MTIRPGRHGFTGVLHGIASLAIAVPQRIIALALLVMVGTAIFGIPVINSLSPGGVRDSTSSSSQAAKLLSDKFNQGNMAMVVSVTSDSGFDSRAASAVGAEIVRRLQNSPNVGQVLSAWSGPAGPSLVSKDRKTGLIVAGISGDDIDVQKRAKRLAGEFGHHRDGVVVRVGGEATVYWQISAQTTKDLFRMELLAMPLSFVVLVWVFGGLVAAAVPLAIGGFTILGSMAGLHAIARFTEVSIFTLDLCIALGMALAIDYTLLILSRYRGELAAGAAADEALIRTMTTAGRTVLFSATTVASSMATLVLFPQGLLKSYAYAGVAVVAFAAAASIVVTPAAIALFGSHLDSLDIRKFLRQLRGRRPPQPQPVEQTFWYRSTKFAMRHAVPITAAIIALLLLLGAPFLGVRWGFPDDRMLPASASARQVGDQLRNDFAVNPVANINVVLPDASGLNVADLNRYAGELSRLPTVSAVSSPGGTFVDGHPAGPPSAPTGIKDGSAFLTITSSAPLFSGASARTLNELRNVTAPGNKTVQLAGFPPSNHDNVRAITSRLPVVLGIIVAVMLLILFLLTGSVVLPIKAVLLNILSLTAAFGALVWVFQKGHLGALGSPVTGALEINAPVLLFCIAFGLSMDYEVFLMSRIREYWLRSDRAPAANDDSVALGVAHTARVITAAALIMSISFAALMATQVSFIRMFGLGLLLAVLVDATLVRMLLVPAFMHLLGRRNWWAPRALARLHDRFGLSETVGDGPREQQAVPETAKRLTAETAQVISLPVFDAREEAESWRR